MTNDEMNLELIEVLIAIKKLIEKTHRQDPNPKYIEFMVFLNGWIREVEEVLGGKQ